MKKFTLATASMLLALLLSFSCLAESSFFDVTDDKWYAKDVAYVTEKGIFNGMSDGSFSPDSPFTRAMFVAVLGRLHGIDTSLYTWKVLGDVSPDDWYGPYVAWAYDNAITQSMGNDDFRPDHNVTREQIATFVARYIKKFTTITPEKTKTERHFADEEKISDFAVESARICAELGIMNGDIDGNFRPSDGITRAEAAAVAARLHALLSESR